jgi:hypothetical protein
MVITAACSTARSDQGDSQTRVGANPSRGTLASQYLRIADAGNDRLEDDIDGLSGRDRDRLAASEADLRDASATEKLFDRRVLGIRFPPALEKIAEALSAANQSRAALTADAATSRTLTHLQRFEAQISAANTQVETQVRLLRAALHLPPPDTS